MVHDSPPFEYVLANTLPEALLTAVMTTELVPKMPELMPEMLKMGKLRSM